MHIYTRILHICVITNNYFSFETMVSMLKVQGKSNLCSNISHWTLFHTDLFQDSKM